MAITLSKLFEPSQVTASLATYYTLGEATTTILENLVIRLTNTTGGAITLDGHVVASGGSSSAVNQFMSDLSVPANDYVLVPVPTMKKDDFLQLVASSATSVTVHHESGMPKTP